MRDLLLLRTSFPPMYIGMSSSTERRSASIFFSSARSGEFGAYDLIGSLMGVGTAKTPLGIVVKFGAQR